MKRKFLKIACIFLIAIAVLNFIAIRPRVLNNNINIEKDLIFIPSGVANKYHDNMIFSFDDYRIWEYRLNNKEVTAIQGELNGDIWKRPSAQEYADIIAVFFEFGSEQNTPVNLTDDVYYCLFDDGADTFIDINSDNTLLGWHRELFLYDVSQKTYWCVARGI